MKRLLAAGSGSIYQICRCFRAGESGRHHNPEFVMLEWYRTGFTLRQLIHEVVELLQIWWPQRPLELFDYRQLLSEKTGLDYDHSSLDDIRSYLSASENVYSAALMQDERDALYDLIFATDIAPKLGLASIAVIANYPASQAQLAQLSEDGCSAMRFEVYAEGIELANGYQELLDSEEQGQRFFAQNRYRESIFKPVVEVDARLLAALRHGLPPCSGVALGLDRLLLLIAGRDSISEVIEFPLAHA